jgi:hypothetical protein
MIAWITAISTAAFIIGISAKFWMDFGRHQAIQSWEKLLLKRRGIMVAEIRDEIYADLRQLSKTQQSLVMSEPTIVVTARSTSHGKHSKPDAAYPSRNWLEAA